MGILSLRSRPCFPPEVLPQHWPPLLRWVRVPSPFPTIIAHMRPSDSPAASPCLRFALGNALPAGQASVLRPVVAFPPRGRPSGRLQPTARRRGSPVLRRPDLPTGQSGVSQVTGSSSSAVPQSSTPPVSLRLAYYASGSAAFRDRNTLSTGICAFRGCIPAAHPLAWLRFNHPLTDMAASLATSLSATL
jgi:hypothetical protein